MRVIAQFQSQSDFEQAPRFSPSAPGFAPRRCIFMSGAAVFLLSFVSVTDPLAVLQIP